MFSCCEFSVKDMVSGRAVGIELVSDNSKLGFFTVSTNVSGMSYRSCSFSVNGTTGIHRLIVLSS